MFVGLHSFKKSYEKHKQQFKHKPLRWIQVVHTCQKALIIPPKIIDDAFNLHVKNHLLIDYAVLSRPFEARRRIA